jgi:hypothetical protein
MRLALALVLGLIATAASAQSRVFHVKNFGVDGPDCGGEFTPCRSISQGIRTASTGDTVLVGPGLYGDLNRNGITGETGEEGPPQCCCLVFISKSMTVLSERGAAHTTIDARNLPLTAVCTTEFGSPAVFGYAEQGFTVLAGEGDGIALGVLSTAWGNRVVGGTVGISSAPQFSTHIFDNEVTDARETGISGRAGIVSGNVVARNGAGIRVFSAALINNTIADNRGPGASIAAPGIAATSVRNLFIRNQGPGLILGGGPSGNNPNLPVVDSNDFIGNDPGGGCGLQNLVRAPWPVWAVNNFWAAAPDFGVTQQVVCDAPGSTTIVDPPRLQPH